MTHWTDYTPEQAAELKLDLSVRTDIEAPLNESGERCPWPWEPEQLIGAPMGQYHCPYCGAMVMAGIPHPDYRNAVEDHAMGKLVQLLGENLVRATMTNRDAIETTVDILNVLIEHDGEYEAVTWMITPQRGLVDCTPIVTLAIGDYELVRAALNAHLRDKENGA